MSCACWGPEAGAFRADSRNRLRYLRRGDGPRPGAECSARRSIGRTDGRTQSTTMAPTTTTHRPTTTRTAPSPDGSHWSRAARVGSGPRSPAGCTRAARRWRCITGRRPPRPRRWPAELNAARAGSAAAFALRPARRRRAARARRGRDAAIRPARRAGQQRVDASMPTPVGSITAAAVRRPRRHEPARAAVPGAGRGRRTAPHPRADPEHGRHPRPAAAARTPGVLGGEGRADHADEIARARTRPRDPRQRDRAGAGALARARHRPTSCSGRS